MMNFDLFPEILRTALESGKVKFDGDEEIDFEQTLVFRCIRRDNATDEFKICKNDFLSQAELGKIPRGMENEIGYYSCSFFENIEPLRLIMHLPKPTKKIIKGIIKKEFGVTKKTENSHIHLWRYDKIDLSTNFEVLDEGGQNEK